MFSNFYFVYFDFLLFSSNHSGNNGSSGSLPSSAGPSLNSEDINNGDHLLNNNNTVDNGIAEVCDVPDDVANQKRHVSVVIHNVYFYSIIWIFFFNLDESFWIK